MTKNQHRRTSKFLSLVLRHQPELVGIQLDPHGWADLDELIEKVNRKNGTRLTRADINKVVVSNDKQRFRLSPDGQQIRASQGHSIEVDLELDPLAPPAVLYHGTATRFLESIMIQGLTKRQRHHVHLSADRTTAHAVGNRHGTLAMLHVDAAGMHEQGHDFYISANGVWLTDSVPAEYLTCR